MTDTTDTTDPRIIGSMHATGDTGTVRMEEVYDTDAADLWSALTVPARLARWLAVVDGQPTLGGELTARFTSGWNGTLRVDVCETSRRLLVTAWTEDEGETVMEAVLTPEGTGTRLVIEERGLRRPDLVFHGAGWQAHVEDLASYLEGREPSEWNGRWRALIPAYETLEILAS